MTAHERYETLFFSYPTTAGDFEANGAFTEEAAYRIDAWTWGQMTEAEQEEFDRHCQMKHAAEEFNRSIDEVIRRGKAERFIDADGQPRWRVI